LAKRANSLFFAIMSGVPQIAMNKNPISNSGYDSQLFLKADGVAKYAEYIMNQWKAENDAAGKPMPSPYGTTAATFIVPKPNNGIFENDIQVTTQGGIYSGEAFSLGDNSAKTTMKWFAQFDTDYPPASTKPWDSLPKKMEGYKFALGVQQEYNGQKGEPFMKDTIMEDVFSTSLLETENDLNWGGLGELLDSAGESIEEYLERIWPDPRVDGIV